MATTTTNFGWDIPQSTDLVKDGATAIAALGQDIDTALVDLKGGTTGQVLSKASGTDLDFTWVAQDDSNAIQNAIVDAKGDLIAATAADTPARLAVGANNTVLTADSSTATGLKWAVPSGGNFTLISRTSFSNVAQQDFTDVFTTTYPSYKIIIEQIYAGTSSDIAQFQVRTSSGVQTASYYGASAVLVQSSSSVSTVANTSGGTSFKLNSANIGNSTSSASSFSFDVVNAAVSSITGWFGVGIGVQAGNVNWFGGYRGATETVTGFRLSASTSNITGTVAIYGYGV